VKDTGYDQRQRDAFLIQHLTDEEFAALCIGYDLLNLVRKISLKGTDEGHSWAREALRRLYEQSDANGKNLWHDWLKPDGALARWRGE
jgi:hypothetical protein